VFNTAKKAGRFLESEGGLLVLTFDSNPEDTTTHYSSKYASIPLPLTLLTNLSYFFLLILGVVGFLISRRKPIWWFTLSLVVSWVLVHTVYFGGGRFHFPLMPFAATFAALSLGGDKELIRTLPRLQKIIGVIIVLLLTSLWVYEGVLIFNG
jgi:hypothetical protein